MTIPASEPITGRIILKRKRDKPVRQRHPWIFSGAIEHIENKPKNGDLVFVDSHAGLRLAIGYYNAHSAIRVRIITWDVKTKIDRDFWQGKIEQALARREQLQLSHMTDAFRVINAEADGVPGLIVDKYGDCLVMQCLTLGIDRRKQMLADVLQSVLQPQAIIERSDASIRKKEGLKPTIGTLAGDTPNNIIITENGIRYAVDVLKGHKTGFYLDQRNNRALVCQPRFVAGKEVLNVFSYTGGFGIVAAVKGARQVVNVDSSVAALEQAEHNLRLNGIDPDEHEQIAADAFQLLRHFREIGRKFDLIILDPPKFAHAQGDIQRAARGYKDLNLLAMQLLRDNGMLATFSCSGAVSAELFQKIVFGASLDAQRNAQIITPLHQASDHPILLTVPESSYLKGLLLRCTVHS